MKKHLALAISLFISQIAFSQNETFINATMDNKSAIELQNSYPNDIQIITTQNNQSAVKLTEKAAHHLHKNILTHGPGYVYQQNMETAVASIYNKESTSQKLLNLTITEGNWVKHAISKVNAENIKTHISTLEAYGTRHHNNPKAKQAALDLKSKWEAMIAASGRNDISVSLYEHTATPMPSVILKINGVTQPSELVIIGGHLDSISNTSQAPGADDNASGIASITEILRILLDINFKPQRSIEIMAFSAEEVGLVGSADIANSYKTNNKNVIAYVQFDMTNYKGSPKDVYLTTDSYNSNDLNLFLIELMEQYNKTGAHAFSYGNTICNYGCSDHFSWAQKGYPAAFPFEARFDDANPYIHSAQDKLSNSGNTANHAAKFTKLGLEFLIEAAKSSQVFLATQNPTIADLKIQVRQQILTILGSQNPIKSVRIIDSSGRLVKEITQPQSNSLSLTGLKEAYYLCIIEEDGGKTSSLKFINQ